MKKFGWKFFLVLNVFALLVAQLSFAQELKEKLTSNGRAFIAEGKAFMQEGKSYGEIEKEAIQNALDKIVGMSGGMSIRSKTSMREESDGSDVSSKFRETIATRGKAKITSYKIVPNSDKVVDGIFQLKVAAVVQIETNNDSRIKVWARDFTFDNQSSGPLLELSSGPLLELMKSTLAKSSKLNLIFPERNNSDFNDVDKEHDYEVCGTVSKFTIVIKENQNKKNLQALFGSEILQNQYDQLRIYCARVEFRFVNSFDNTCFVIGGNGKYTENAMNAESGAAVMEVIVRSFNDLEKNLLKHFGG